MSVPVSMLTYTHTMYPIHTNASASIMIAMLQTKVLQKLQWVTRAKMILFLLVKMMMVQRSTPREAGRRRMLVWHLLSEGKLETNKYTWTLQTQMKQLRRYVKHR